MNAGLRLYERAPHWARQTAVWVAGLRQARLRYGKLYYEQLARLRLTETATADELRRLQVSRLRQLLVEARSSTEHYRDTLAGWSADALDEIARGLAIRELPLLDKATLKANTAHFANAERTVAATARTSGSTGSPLEVEFDRDSLQMRLAFMHRHREWAGAPHDARAVRLSGNQVVPSRRRKPPFALRNPAEHQLLVSTYHLNETGLPAILEAMQRFDPEIIDGYPSAVAQIAEFARRREVRLPALRAAIVTAETLTPDLRAAITAGLGVPVLNYYAASEGVPLIQECPSGRLHLRVESGIFEVLRDDGARAGPGEWGELVVTSFVQWRMPLIRYRTGDWVATATDDAPCACGRSLPSVGEILGRVEDMVLTPDGRRLGMFSYRTIKHVRGIAEAQIVQRSPHSFLVCYVPTHDVDCARIEADLARVFTSVLGYAPDLRLQEVAALARGANGKLRSVIREF